MKRLLYVLCVAAAVGGGFAAAYLAGRHSQTETVFHITQQPVVSQGAGRPVTVVVDGATNPVGDYQELTLDTSTVQELTLPAGAHLVWLQAGGNNIRYRLDDADPTTSVGFVLAAGDYMLPPGILRKMRFLAESGTATLRAQPLGL
jgi:hypothetical protein